LLLLSRRLLSPSSFCASFLLYSPLALLHLHSFPTRRSSDLTGLHDQISVQDIGIDNLTAADGLAVGRASGFVGRAMERLLDGFRSEEHTSELQSRFDLVCRLLLEKKK